MAFKPTATPIADIEIITDTNSLACGFPTFEELGLIRKGQPDLITLAARPGVGKTALACQIGLNVSKNGNVLMYSVEMSKEQIVTRMIAVEAQKPIKKLGISANKAAVEAARDRFRGCQFAIDDTPAIDIGVIAHNTREFQRVRPISLIIVDYLQIVKAHAMRSKHEEVGAIAECLKTLAKESRCPVLAVAQMNRQFDGRLTDDKDARPIMSDLADSAGIEKWSDVVMCLHRPTPAVVSVFVLKNRHGESQDFDLRFSGEQTRFYDDGGI